MDDPGDIVVGDCRVVVRGKNKGKGLDRMSRGGRPPLQILPGRTRPDDPVVATKFATAGGLFFRSEMPLFTSWKKYKERLEVRANFQDKLGVRFLT